MLFVVHLPDMSAEFYHDAEKPQEIQYAVCSCADLVFSGSRVFFPEETIAQSIAATYGVARARLAVEAMKQRAAHASTSYLQ